MKDVYTLRRSPRSEKKFSVTLPTGKTVHFGAAGYSDFTKHKDTERRARYIARHTARESHTKSGIDTAGFWARWLLWNKPTLEASIKDMEQRFNIKIVFTRRSAP